MSKHSPFEIDSERHGKSARIRASGELDLATCPQLEHELRSALGQGVRDVIVDLSHLNFIDSSGLRTLIVAYDRSLVEGWELQLIPPPEPARTILRISGADEHLPFADTDGVPGLPRVRGEEDDDAMLVEEGAP